MSGYKAYMSHLSHALCRRQCGALRRPGLRTLSSLELDDIGQSTPPLWEIKSGQVVSEVPSNESVHKVWGPHKASSMRRNVGMKHQKTRPEVGVTINTNRCPCGGARQHHRKSWWGGGKGEQVMTLLFESSSGHSHPESLPKGVTS